MYLEILIIVLLVGLAWWLYKSFNKFKYSLSEIYAKFDTIYYMLCDIIKKKHERSEKRRKK